MNTLVTFAALCIVALAVTAQVHQGGPHQNQGRIRRQADQSQPEEVQGPDDADQPDGPNDSPLNWTTCDVTATPRISCHDCHTRLICKPVGGLLKGCNNPYRPYCNYGVCSPLPSLDCVGQ
ncbi:hypothetical protein JYU34_001844 [Plutella xylostella]|uniref:Uncharacterized protein n=1 Tax=Plutella xylostella TaxID=51655 RepID=A0ABQ7R4Y0_PLUXY|nr:hypothetical protein JYU34_001844 [Plutella xylostella]